MSVGSCVCDTTEQHPVSECLVPGQSDDETRTDDVRAIAVALGLGGHARPYSAHAVVHREILPAIRNLMADQCHDACTRNACEWCPGEPVRRER